MISTEQVKEAKKELQRLFPGVSFGLGYCAEGWCVEARTGSAVHLPDRVRGVPVQVRQTGVISSGEVSG